jgi:hypothetical protein
MSESKLGSVLGPCRPDDLRHEPYAYTVVDNPIEAAVYERLAASFPPVDWFTESLAEVQSNQAIRIPASQVLGNDKFSPEWREFFRHHTSTDFWREIVALFGDDLRRAYPDLEAKVGRRFEDWRTKLRNAEGEADLHVDLLFVINTPVDKPNSVRPPHVDNERKIFSGVFYMRPEGDLTPGGNLAVYRAFGQGAKKGLRFGGHYVENRAIEQSELIEYKANRFIGFVNSAESVHGVTQRPQTDRVRRYINFVFELPFPIFKLDKLPWHRKQLLRLTRRGKAAGVTLGYGAGED